MDVIRNSAPITPVAVIPEIPETHHFPVLSMDEIEPNTLPEMERFTVELKKDVYGLGITIAGYVCEKGKNLECIKKHFPFLTILWFVHGEYLIY